MSTLTSGSTLALARGHMGQPMIDPNAGEKAKQTRKAKARIKAGLRKAAKEEMLKDKERARLARAARKAEKAQAKAQRREESLINKPTGTATVTQGLGEAQDTPSTQQIQTLQKRWGAEKRHKDRNPGPRVEVDLTEELEVFGITEDDFEAWWAGYNRNKYDYYVQLFDGLNHAVGRLITAIPGWCGSWQDWCNGEGAQATAYLANANSLYKALVYVGSKADMPFSKWKSVDVTGKTLWFDLGIRNFNDACDWLYGALPYVLSGLNPRMHIEPEACNRLGQVVVSLRKDEIKALSSHIRKSGGLGRAMEGRVGTLSSWYSACRVWKYAPHLSKGIALRMKSLSPKALKWFNCLAKEIMHGSLVARYEQKVNYANLLDADQYLRSLTEVRQNVAQVIDSAIGTNHPLPAHPLEAVGYLNDQLSMVENLKAKITRHTKHHHAYMSAKLQVNYNDLYLFGVQDVALTLKYIDDLAKDLSCAQYDKLDELFALPSAQPANKEACHIYDWHPTFLGSSGSSSSLVDRHALDWLTMLKEAVEQDWDYASLVMNYGTTRIYGQELCAYAYMLCDNYVHSIEEAKKLLAEQKVPTHNSSVVTEVVPYKGYVAISCSREEKADTYKWTPGKGVWAGTTGIVEGYGSYANLVYVNTLKGKRGEYNVGDADSARHWTEDYGVNPSFNGQIGAISFKADLAEGKQSLNSRLVDYIVYLQREKVGSMPIRGEMARVEVGEGGGWKAFLNEVTVRGERGIPELVAFAAGDLKSEAEVSLPLKELFLVRLVTAAMGWAKRDQDSARAAGYQWLAHYALGTGKDKTMPDAWVRPWLKDMAHSADKDGNFMWASDRWEGRGFDSRPHGFYTVGGFSGHYDRETDVITFKDVYDWHPMQRTSPQGMGTTTLWCWSEMDLPTVDLEQLVKYLPKFTQGWAVKALRHFGLTNVDLHAWTERLLGSQYYGHSDFFGVKGLSNKLWHDLQAVGAKPFSTVYTGKVNVEEKPIVAGPAPVRVEEDYDDIDF